MNTFFTPALTNKKKSFQGGIPRPKKYVRHILNYVRHISKYKAHNSDCVKTGAKSHRKKRNSRVRFCHEMHTLYSFSPIRSRT